jgi:hypothetical protein
MLGTTPSFQEISDQYFSNFWTIQGLASLGFFLFNWALSWNHATPWHEMTWSHWRTQTIPAFLWSCLSAGGVFLLFLATTPFQYFGSGWSWTEAPWSALNWLTRSAALIGMALGEEWVFRKVLFEDLRRLLRTRLHHFSADRLAILITALLWTGTRTWHQSLGISQTVSLLFLGIWLASRVWQGRSYLEGAAILGAFAWIFQAFFSLPLMGHEFSGIWIFKFPSTSGPWSPWPRWISGGAGGPLSSVLLQLFLLGAIIKIHWKAMASWLRSSP